VGYNPVSYKIEDVSDEEIKATFNEQEIQKSTQTKFRIEKVLQTKGSKLLVKRLGYSEAVNSWVHKKDDQLTGSIPRT
jgi:hypothetical protein